MAVADAVPEAAKAIAAAYSAEVRSVEAIMNAKDVDAVLITTPTDLHADMIEQAARAGKAIFCEKPIDLAVERVRRCLDVARAEKAALMIGFNRRFDPNFMEARARIDAGVIGEVEMVSIISRDPAPPPPAYVARSGGMFRDMTIHDFDMAAFLLGEDPVTVFAAASNLVDPAIGAAGDVDSASLVLTTKSGKIAQISNSRRATYGYDQRIEVHGSKGLVSAENVRATTRGGGERRRLPARPAAELLHDALHAGVRQRDRRLHRGAGGGPADEPLRRGRAQGAAHGRSGGEIAEGASAGRDRLLTGGPGRSRRSRSSPSRCRATGAVGCRRNWRSGK